MLVAGAAVAAVAATVAVAAVAVAVAAAAVAETTQPSSRQRNYCTMHNINFLSQQLSHNDDLSTIMITAQSNLTPPTSMTHILHD